MQRVKKHIPNLFTAFNLFYGCQAIVAALDDNLRLAAIFIAVAAVLDFFDGFAARLLNRHSAIGEQLDSLADMVSFGVAPGMIFYKLSQDYLVFDAGFIQFVPLIFLITYLPFLIPVFSGMRLAKFNIDERQTDSFIGLPTPANAIFIASIPLVLENDSWNMSFIFTNSWFLILFPVVISYLLVAELPLIALKFKNMQWQGNQVRFIFLLLCVLSLVVFRYLGITLCIFWYILLSLINNYKTENAK